MQTSQAPQPTQIHTAPQGQGPPQQQPPQQQIMMQAAASPNLGPAPGHNITMQHTQYAPAHQQGNHVQGTSYAPPPQQQQQQQQYAPQQQQQPQQMQYAPQPQQQQQLHLPAAPPQQQQQQQAPPPPQQQQMYTQHQGLNGGWQSDQDYGERRKMIAKIVHLLKQRKPNAPQDWLKKLPQMAKRLEESLYRSAKSFEEYNDASTLKQRLQQLAHSIGMKTKRIQQAQMAQRQQQQPQPGIVQQQPPPQPQPIQYQPQLQQQQQQQPPPQQAMPSHQQPLAPMQHQQQQHQQMQPHQQMQHGQASGLHQPMQHPPQIQPIAPGQRIVNVAEINPIMGQPSQQQQQQPLQPAPVHYQPPPQNQQPTTNGAQSTGIQPGAMQTGGMQMQPGGMQLSAPAPGLPPAPGQQPPMPLQNGRSVSGGVQNRQVSDRQQVLRHQQQRLLLLRHAAKCHHEDGRCLVTPHCAGMKRLWKHIAECKDQKCLVPHCVSSRYVLSHYHRCKDVRCPVCGPVREAIHRSHEKQKQMQASKQRQQQAMQQSQQGQPPQPIQPAPGPMPIQQPQEPVQYPIPAGSGEPPNKRQRTSISLPFQVQSVAPPPGQLIVPSQYQQQQPMAGVPPPASILGQPQPIPTQPPKPAYFPPQQPLQQQLPPIAAAQMPARPLIASAPGVKFANGQVITPKFTGPKPQEDHTLINCFSIEQIETHIASLNKGLQLPPQKLKSKCLEVLKVLQSHQHGWVFNSPVDPIELGLPDYFEVIKNPMDLGTIRKKLENNCYHCLADFKDHVHLTFDNAMLYNPEGSVVYNMAKEMKDKFEKDYNILIDQLEKEEDVKRRNGEACLLCGCEKLLFEPPVFYCNGVNCPSKRIRRNSYYYVGGNNQYHWCHQCFADLKDHQLLELGDIAIRKEQLVKKKNDETHEESWVQCDRCERWVHQICALFNTRQNKDQRSEYACPKCTIDERRQSGRHEATSSTPMAEDLQRTKLSEYVENHVRQKMEEHLKHLAQEKSEKEGISIEEAQEAVHMGGTITIRQVTSMDRKLEVRERMKRRYAFKNYPDEFNYRCKCFVVFQNLDGVDVMLFGLYVYEHDEKNPLPNKRTVYVSYLDSVHYMRPRSMRTFIYHEILISYLDYVRRRGFATAHIWACPPLKGDDYILYAKPEDQKTPKDDRLRAWYIDMLVECQKRGIVGKITNMYDLYFSNKYNDASVVPYMDGDYFPAEVENIIKDIEEGKAGKKNPSKEGKKKKGEKKQKKKSGRGGTRSSGLDEEALKASGVQFPDNDKSLEEGGRDIVMTKLGETIQPMKESFIVAFLAWKGAKDEEMVVPKEIQEYREKHNISIDFECDGDSQVGKFEAVSPVEPKVEDSTEVENEQHSNETGLSPSRTSYIEGSVSQQSRNEGPESTRNAIAHEMLPNEASQSKDPDISEMDTKNNFGKSEAVYENAIAVKKETVDEAGGNLDVKSDSKADDGQDQSAVEVSDRTKASEEPQSDTMDIEKPADTAKLTNEIRKSNGGEDKEGKVADDDTHDAQDLSQKKSQDKADAENAGKKVSTQNSFNGPNETPSSNNGAAESERKSQDKDINGTNGHNKRIEEDGKHSMSSETADDQPKEKSHVVSLTLEDVSMKDTGDYPKSSSEQETIVKMEVVEESNSGGVMSSKVSCGALSDSSEKSRSKLSMEERSGKFAAMAKKRGISDQSPDNTNGEKKEGTEIEKDKAKESEAEAVPAVYVVDSKGRRVKVIDDDAEEMDCEFLNNRQAFLNLCQGNHYQFDQLRRAKHSSMMVLWHLHNRDAPKFVQQCTSCSREILQGYRFHCPICADFDQCQECVQNPNTPRHPHQLKAIPVSGQNTELTDAQRKERQRSIQLHMTLLLHAATCISQKCPSANCTKMKGLLKHGAQCQQKATGGCSVCKRIWALLQIHARQCKAQQCPVPNCMAIRERVRQLKKQQQAMDDRRRQEMNRVYGGAR